MQNNHAPYTMVPGYEDRFPELPAGMRRVYNSNMAAIDDAIGVLKESLEAHPDTYENRTLIVFSADNGGPGKSANNLPLRGDGSRIPSFTSLTLTSSPRIFSQVPNLASMKEVSEAIPSSGVLESSQRCQSIKHTAA